MPILMMTSTSVDVSNEAYALHAEAIEHRNKGEYTEAAAKWQQCVALIPDEPAYLREYADCLGRMKDWSQQRRIALLAVALEPTSPEAWGLAGCACGNLGKQADARRYYDKSLAIAPNSPAIMWNRSLHCLLHGEYEQGWRDYEHRFVQHQKYRNPKPMWDGRPIPGRVLFVWAEQGIGDTIQFIRFLRRARAVSQCSRLVLECQRELVPLLLDAGYADDIVSQGTGWSIHETDFEHVALMSLPYVLGINYEGEFEPTPYIFAEPLNLPPYLGASFLDNFNKNIGVCWRGYAGHNEDSLRSIGDDEFFNAIIKPSRGSTWWSINPTVRLPDAPNCLNIDLPTFNETAALIAAMDLVITVDTSVAHLAGAMGKPVWLLNRYATDWRWCLNHDNSSPWYPSMRIFRQKAYGEGWGNVLAVVAEALNA